MAWLRQITFTIATVEFLDHDSVAFRAECIGIDGSELVCYTITTYRQNARLLQVVPIPILSTSL